MINERDNPAAWALLIMDLDEAREHLESMINQMNTNGIIEEEDLAVQLGHVFGHLNRNWNARSLDGSIPDRDYDRFSQFPDDLEPI